jgi:arginyl-tRNA synthetase
LKAALSRAVATLGVADADVQLERPRDPSHGDLATNIAMTLAKPLRRPPRAIAEAIVEALDPLQSVVTAVEIAGPGFINFRLATEALTTVLHRILDDPDGYGRSVVGAGRRVNVEFVSANPTGPLHVGHGRGAALGDAIASLLAATGYTVSREFYVNDAGVQIEKLACSLWARVQEAAGRAAEVPEGGYHGAYLVELAERVVADEGRAFADLDHAEGIARCREIAVRTQREEQERDLRDFGVAMDEYFLESKLYDGGHLVATIEALASAGLTYERDGALWLATTQFGDAKDRVLRKGDGTYTYFLPDIAYHRSKAERGFDWAIDVWGADHHGYVPRMRAAMQALGRPESFFTAVVVQLVRLVRGATEVRFSKRSGEFVALRDLFEETGADAARYFFLMRRGDAQFTFDIELATRQTDENPVYYVQYAHTRMAGISRNAAVDPATVTGAFGNLELLREPAEQELIKQLGDYPMVVARAAEALEPHRVTAYAEEVARLVNQWYHHHRVLGVPDDVSRARLVLARGAQIVLRNALTLLGVSAPERM